MHNNRVSNDRNFFEKFLSLFLQMRKLKLMYTCMYLEIISWSAR